MAVLSVALSTTLRHGSSVTSKYDDFNRLEKAVAETGVRPDSHEPGYERACDRDRSGREPLGLVCDSEAWEPGKQLCY